MAGVGSTVRFTGSMVVTLFSIFVLCGSASATDTANHPAAAPSHLAFDREDLNFILKQIKFAEEHVELGGTCADLLSVLPNASIPWGLRTVDGTCNNLIEGNEGFGAADLEFLELVEPVF